VSDTTGADGAPAAPDAQPPAGTADAPAADADAGGTPPAATPETLSVEDARKLRSEANSLRKRLKEFEDAETARKDADKTESERTAEKLATLERERDAERAARQAMALQIATVGIARKLNFRDPEIAHRLVDGAQVAYDDAGTPTNIEKLLSDVARQHPSLVSGQPDFGGGPRGTPPGPGGDSMNDWIRARTGRS